MFQLTSRLAPQSPAPCAAAESHRRWSRTFHIGPSRLTRNVPMKTYVEDKEGSESYADAWTIATLRLQELVREANWCVMAVSDRCCCYERYLPTRYTDNANVCYLLIHSFYLARFPYVIYCFLCRLWQTLVGRLFEGLAAQDACIHGPCVF